MNDKEIIKKITEKNESVFNSLVQGYINLFYAIIQKIFQDEGTREDVTDCLSESLIYIWDNIEKCDLEKYSVKSWCCFIVMNRAKNYLQKIRHHQEKIIKYETIIHDESHHICSAEDTYFEKWTNEEFKKELAPFSEAAQKVFIYRYVYGMKPKDIANKIGLTTKQIDNHLAYVKKKLRQKFQSERLKQDS